MKISQVDLKQQLQWHLTFLKTSSREYDNGVKEEALRIAVSLRVLFHDYGNNSISLLTHMNMKNNVQLASTAGTIDEALLAGQDFATFIPLTFGNEIAYQRGEIQKYLSVEAWLKEPVFYQGIILTRHDVIQASANKDGGAHVDVRPHKGIESLREPFFTKSTIEDGVTISTEDIGNHHFPLLRQFAYEVLNSKDLTDLVT